jgi:DNA ligase-1
MKDNQKLHLEELQLFVQEMKNTSSLIAKKEIIKSYKGNNYIENALYYTYNPFLKYYVTSKSIEKNTQICDLDQPYTNLWDLLDALHNREYTGHHAIALVNGFITNHMQFKNLILSIIDRNLEIRASESVINKVIPNLIPTFDVALATKYESKFLYCDEAFDADWYASRKLDGVRCIIRKEGNEVTAYSRQGNEFTTLDVIKTKIESLKGDFVLDGEICMMDENGDEDFQGIMKQIKRKDHTIENPKYIVFDCLTLEEFDSKKGLEYLMWRLERAPIEQLQMEQLVNDENSIVVLDHFKLKDEKHLMELIDEAEKAGHEGVMLRKDCTYEGKRTKNLLKCKKFHDAEYKVISVDFDDHRIIRDGKEVVVPMLAQAYITHKGHEVAVGSGWSQEQRIRYESKPEELIGKTITVQYFEETKNQDGGISLRFPTVKHVYENGREC